MMVTRSNNVPLQQEKLNVRSWLFFFILFALVSFLVVYYFSQIKKEIILLEKIKPYWLGAALIAQFMTYYFTATIYLLLIRIYKPQQAPRLWELIKASVVSLFFNQTMPSAGISGNMYFFNFLAKFNVPRTQIISIIVSELLIFYAAMEAAIVSLLLICLFAYNSASAFKVTLAVGIAVYLAFGSVIAFVGRKNAILHAYEGLKKAKILHKLFAYINKKIPQEAFSENGIPLAQFMKSNKNTVWKTFLLQLLVVVADAFTVYALFWGLGYPVPAFVVLLSLVSTKIVSLLPFLPGSLILYESSMSFFFASAGIPVGIGIIVTLLYRLLSFWLPIPIGLILYRRWMRNAAAQNK